MPELPLHPDDIRELARLRNKLDSVRGPGVTNTRESIVINPGHKRRQLGSGQRPKRETISGLITSNASANGAYNGKSFTDRTSDVAPSGSIAEADFGTLAAAEDCLVLNAAELGLATPGHYVTAAVNTAQFAIYFVGRLVRTNSNGIMVVEVYMPWAGC